MDETEVMDDRQLFRTATLKRNQSRQLQFQHKLKEAKQWIEKILDVELPEDTLLQELRDGYYLCKLLQKIEPKLIPKEPHKEKAPFKMMDTVSYFLKSCHTYGLVHTFTPGDLVNGSNFSAVVDTIHELSDFAAIKGYPIFIERKNAPNSLGRAVSSKFAQQFVDGKGTVSFRTRPTRIAEVRKSRDPITFSSFHTVSDYDTSVSQNPSDIEDSKILSRTQSTSSIASDIKIYNSEELLNKLSTVTAATTPPSITPTITPTTSTVEVVPESDSRDNEGKQEIVKTEIDMNASTDSLPEIKVETQPEKKKPKKLKKKQTLISMSADCLPLPEDLPKPDPVQLEKQERMRLHVIREIIKTEQDYVRDLVTMVTIFMEGMRKITENSTVNSIFSNIEIIRKVNTEMLQKLEERIADASPKYWIVGDIFLEMADFLKMYQNYCSNQESALAMLKECCKSSKFNKWLEETHLNPLLHGLNIKDYLVKPVQRICKYPLLLKELLKYTHDMHVDYDKLLAAHKKLHDIASQVNEAKRHEENVTKILEIQNSLVGCESIILPGRKFIREGLVECGKETYQIYLFSDILLLSKASSSFFSVYRGSLRFKKKINLLTMTVTDGPVSKERGRFCFTVVVNSMSGENEKYVFAVKSKEEKDFWIDDINRTSEELTANPRSRTSTLNQQQVQALSSALAENKRTSGSLHKYRQSLMFSSSDLEGKNGESGLSSWRKSSSGASLDAWKTLQEEKAKRIFLEEWQQQHIQDVDALKEKLKKANETSDKTQKENVQLRDEIEQLKDQLVTMTVEVMQLKEQIEEQPTTDPEPSQVDKTRRHTASLGTPKKNTKKSATISFETDAAESADSTKHRPWNRKLISDLQDLMRQVNTEKKKARELEEWKTTNEPKLEELRKKFKQEFEARVQMEEAYKKLEREMEMLKANVNKP